MKTFRFDVQHSCTHPLASVDWPRALTFVSRHNYFSESIMKKSYLVMSALVLSLGLVACGKKEEAPAPVEQAAPAAEAPAPAAEAPAETTAPAADATAPAETTAPAEAPAEQPK